jgi:hypothetical protein
VLLAALTALAPPAGAQDAPQVGETSIGQTTTVDLATAPVLPSVPMPAGLTINRPTPTARAAPAGHGPSRPAASSTPSTSGVSLYFQTPSINETSPVTCCGGFPPDGDIATSQHFTIQIVNYALTMYNLDNGTLAKQVSLASFFGDSSSFLFDPRIIYDPFWQRFVVLVDACNPCSPAASVVSFFRFAVSTTSDPTGSWYLYSTGVGTNTGDFADFEQLGMDLNSFIITYNDFLGNGGFDARTFAFPKAYYYNGLVQNVPIFGGSGCTIAPPYVLDNHGPSYTLVACGNDNGIYLGPMYNTGLSNVSLTHWQAKVAVAAAWSVPPCAPQPGVNYCLETTLDNAFENRSLQVGDRIWNVHTETASGVATPRYYEINTSSNTIANDQTTNYWFATGTSSDWHPSIVANTVGATGSSPTGETFGTWMSVDSANNVNLNLHAIGGTGDFAGEFGGVQVGPASATALTNQTFPDSRHRSGDYSYISMFPGPVGACQANEFAILEGEVAFNLTNWGTRVGIVKHC